MTSGSRSLNNLTTSSPSAASPTTSKSGWVPSTATRPSRSIGWSSATRSVILSILGHPERNRDLHARSAARIALHFEAAADRVGPLAHADDAVPLFRDVRRVE